MVSKLVTFRSIWRSALLISVVGCGATMDVAHPPAVAGDAIAAVGSGKTVYRRPGRGRVPESNPL
jgi:hypothetical protein